MPKSAKRKEKDTKQNNAVETAEVEAEVIKEPALFDYGETQENELEALRAIYMDDFTELVSKQAWSKATEKSFKLRLNAYSERDVFVDLIVVLTATYPRTIPKLSLGHASKVTGKCLDDIADVVVSRPRELLGEVMIHDIATTVQDILEDEVVSKALKDAESAKVPSLEQERAITQAAQFLQQQEAKARKDAETKQEEHQELQRLLEDLEKRRVHTKPSRGTTNAATDVGVNGLRTLTFDKQIHYQNDGHGDCTFKSVCLNLTLSEKTDYAVYLGGAICQPPAIFVVKTATFRQIQAIGKIIQLEKQLETLKHLQSNSLVKILDYMLDHSASDWTFTLLTEYANQGSLADMLGVVGTLPTPKSRVYGVEILHALDYLHCNGLFHGCLHCGNVMLHRLPNRTITVKLCDAGFSHSVSHLLTDKRNHFLGRRVWQAPELSPNRDESSFLSDIWDFGIVLVEVLLGAAVFDNYGTATALLDAHVLSAPFHGLLQSVFSKTPKLRPKASDLAAYEFFRVNVSAFDEINTKDDDKQAIGHISLSRRFRHESSTGMEQPVSRYLNEWDEIGRLGKGGFGEVVKARNKLDNRLYAVKKIMNKTSVELTQVLSEVHLLATLDHPYVVRYYTAWPEEVTSNVVNASNDFTDGSMPLISPRSRKLSLSFDHSTGGLDFISSSGYPKIEFGYDDDEVALEDGEISVASSGDQSGTESSLNVNSVSRRVSRSKALPRSEPKSTLYIQMEFCERLTLRDISLAHIHSHNVVHRDLKPENIFIDAKNSPRIGDFGLAKSGQFSTLSETSTQPFNPEMTSNVGTALYAAPELQAKGVNSYSEKVDMYSLGIILFEMCYYLATGMERHEEIGRVRKKDHSLPDAFKESSKAVESEIINQLLSHRPSARPTATEILRGGKIPVQIEDEAVKLAIEGLADVSSPYHYKMMASLFSSSSGAHVKAHAWDLTDREVGRTLSLDYMLVQTMVKNKVQEVFRRHGCIEVQRQGLFPYSDLYENKTAVKLLDPSGVVVQLPYDLTLPLARAIAKQARIPEKSYTFGTVYRDSLTNGAPRTNREVDFDIISYAAQDLALQEAEIIKIMDELIDQFPTLQSAPMCFHISHSDILDIIMTFCRIQQSQVQGVKDTIGKLNIQDWTWAKIRTELRGPPLNIPTTSVDEIANFDFRDSPERALAKLQTMFSTPEHIDRLHDVFTHISGVIEYCRRMGVKRKILISPLSSVNEAFYQGGIMFQCVFDTKKRAVLAAGGRFDELITSQLPRIGAPNLQAAHGVGMNLAIDTVVSSMVRFQTSNATTNLLLKKINEGSPDKWSLVRCDVLVSSADQSVARLQGIRLVAELWGCGLSAELADEFLSLEELTARAKNNQYSWVISIRHEPSAKTDYRVRSIDKGEDFDIQHSDLMPLLGAEMAERDEREGANERMRLLKHVRHPADTEKANVRVLMASHKSKKSNKMRIIDSARNAARELLHSGGTASIVAIEIREEVFERIRETRLNDPDSWRRLIQDVSLNEREYLREAYAEIERLKSVDGGAETACFVYNFLSGSCMYYDMKA